MNRVYLVGKYKQGSVGLYDTSIIRIEAEGTEFQVVLGSLVNDVTSNIENNTLIGVTGRLRKLDRYCEIEIVAEKITVLSAGAIEDDKRS